MFALDTDDCASEGLAQPMPVPTRNEAPPISEDTDLFAEREQNYATIAAQHVLIDAQAEEIRSLQEDLREAQGRAGR